MFAIALLVASATASAFHGSGHGSHGHYSAPHQAYAPVAHSYAPTAHSYHAPAQNHYVHAHKTSFEPADVWTPVATAANTEGWYSATQQYSPPKIAFVPDTHEPIFGICEISNAVAGTEQTATEVDLPGNGQIQFAQFPGKPTLYRYDFASTLTTPDSGVAFSVTINETGNNTFSALACDRVGDEFNPLAEFYYGVANKFQDPLRGTIADITNTDTGASQTSPTFVLQNLEDLFGRSLTFTSSTDATMKKCCVIGRDTTPTQYKKVVFPYQQSPSYTSAHGSHVNSHTGYPQTHQPTYGHGSHAHGHGHH